MERENYFKYENTIIVWFFTVQLSYFCILIYCILYVYYMYIIVKKTKDFIEIIW